MLQRWKLHCWVQFFCFFFQSSMQFSLWVSFLSSIIPLCLLPIVDIDAFSALCVCFCSDALSSWVCFVAHSYAVLIQDSLCVVRCSGVQKKKKYRSVFVLFFVCFFVGLCSCGPRHRRRRVRVRKTEISISGVKLHPREADPRSAFTSSMVNLFQLKCRPRPVRRYRDLAQDFPQFSNWNCLTASKPSFKAQVAPAEPFQYDCVLHTVNLTWFALLGSSAVAAVKA